MIIKTLTPVQATTSLVEGLALATFIKQPMWLRIATIGSYANVLLAKRSGNAKAVYIAEGVDFVISSIRFANVIKTKQFKKEFGLGIGLAMFSSVTVALDEYKTSMKA